MSLHRRIVRTAIAFAGLAAAVAIHAEERILFKSVLPNGRVVYSDAPAPNAKRTEEITIEPHALTREQLLRDAAARTARLRQLDNQIADTYNEHKEAQSRREAGRDVQESDKQGRRLLATYFDRQRVLEGAVQQTRQRLDLLLSERSALQY